MKHHLFDQGVFTGFFDCSKSFGLHSATPGPVAAANGQPKTPKIDLFLKFIEYIALQVLRPVQVEKASLSLLKWSLPSSKKKKLFLHNFEHKLRCHVYGDPQTP